MQRVELAIGEEHNGDRIDRCIAKACGLSRTVVHSLLEEGHILLNGEKPAKSRKLAAGDRLTVEIPPPQEVDISPQNIPLDIVFEDESLLVVNKPKGLVVHPAPGNPNGTLVNALMHHCQGSLSGIGGELRPGIVHRIDKDTSGLLVVAKTDSAHTGLAQQFARHSIARVYDAVVYGHMKDSSGRVDVPIGRNKNDRKKMAVTPTASKHAVTDYSVVSEYPGFTHLKLRLQTGRTHQIRVHMASIGHPLAGDTVYGPQKAITALRGQCLHAGTLGFVHPKTGEDMNFEAPLPEYFVQFLRKIAGTANHLSQGEDRDA